MVRSIVFAAALLLAPVAMQAQGSHGDVPGTWDVFGGISVLRNTYSGVPPQYVVNNATIQLPYPTGTPQYNYGWGFSLTQRLEEHRWVGGTIEGSGFYSSSMWTVIPTNGAASYTVKNSMDTYTAMAGPVIQAKYGMARPFAHVLFGAVVTTTFVTAQGQSNLDISNDYFGDVAGGGVDFRISKHAGIRTQADYLRIWSQNNGNPNNLRLMGGIVLH